MISDAALEEILLGYLRSNRNIKLANTEVSDLLDSKEYTIKFLVNNKFANSNLFNPVNPFQRIFSEDLDGTSNQK